PRRRTARRCRKSTASPVRTKRCCPSSPKYGPVTRSLEEMRSALQDAASNGAAGGGRLSASQTQFERARADYERAVQKALASTAADSDYDAALHAYQDAERVYKEAEAAYLEQRQPFEAAVAAA